MAAIFYIFNSTVIDWTCYIFFYYCWLTLSLQQYRNGWIL